MARAQGARSQLAAAFETTYGTAPASGYMQMPFTSASLGAEQPLLSSELLGYGRDPLAPIKDAVTADGDVAVPIDAEAFGFWLKAGFGVPTTTGTTNKTHWQHEPCWYAVRAKGKGHWAGDRKQTTLWQIANKDQDAETVHGTQKPVECMRRPILNNSSPGQAVYREGIRQGRNHRDRDPAKGARNPCPRAARRPGRPPGLA